MKKRILISAFLLVVLLAAGVIAASQTIRECKREVSAEKRAEYKECFGDYKECRKNCSQEKKTCVQDAKEKYYECRENCTDRYCKRECSKSYRTKRKECSKKECLKECRKEKNERKNEAKEKYKKNREKCETTPFDVGQEDCEKAGGFYHEICNGPYFDIICSPKKFCICDGESEHGCPANHTCNHHIRNLLPRRMHTIQGYKDLLGNELGDIGICEKQE
jgi:hypothetical protein